MRVTLTPALFAAFGVVLAGQGARAQALIAEPGGSVLFDESRPRPAAPAAGVPQPAYPAPAAGARPPGAAEASPGRGVGDLDPYTPLDDEHRAWRNAVAAPGQSAPGYKPLRWRPGRVGIINGRAFKTTYIELPPCEVVVGAWVGDEAGFKLRAPGVGLGDQREAARRAGFPLNSVQVTPVLSGSDTSVHIRTASGRLYTFQVFAEELQVKHVSDLTVEVQVDGLCGSPDAATPASADGDFVRTIPFDVARLRRGAYRTFGSSEEVSWLVPDEILTDGLWVLMDFGERAEAMARPAAFVIVDGAPRPASQRWIGERGQILAVRNPTDQMLLQSGQAVLCIRRAGDGEPSPPPRGFTVTSAWR